ncbi:MAG: hypothetical protein LUF02_08170 [Erysipelotrichaceae bacterium]|nr:hypothetical protein [Erysipelotrichaceae bacterium]
MPDRVNADLMNDEELLERIKKAYNDIKTGNVQNTEIAFSKFNENH